MEFNLETFEQIDSYLHGEMNEYENADFERRIAHHPELAAEVKLHRELMRFHAGESLGVKEPELEMEAFLASDEAKQFQEKLQQALKKHKSRTTSPPKTNRKNIRWGIVVGILLVLGILLGLLLRKSTAPAALYAQYKKVEPLALTQKSDNITDWTKIESAFNQGDYQASASLLQSVLDTLATEHPYRFELELAQGVALRETNQIEAATRILVPLSESDAINAPKAHWQLILTYLKAENTDKAKEAIDDYLSANHSYKQAEIKAIDKKMGD